MSNDNSPNSPDSGRSSAFDKLSETLDTRMLNFDMKLLGVLASILFKPAAIATEPFFRKNMGERYFTFANGVLALMIWGGVGVLNKLFAGAGEFDARTAVAYTETMGGLIEVAFLILAGANVSAARERQKKGIRWHSMSRGESWFGSENPARDWIITALVVFGLYELHAALFAAFFLISRIFSDYLEQQRQQSLYNRYLDIMDGQVEAEYLQRTMAKGPAPMVTDGIYCPLPRHFKGEHREKVARVVAGTFSVPDVAAAPAASSLNAKTANLPDPLSQWAEEAKPWAGQLWKILRDLCQFIGRKRLLYLIGAILLALAIRHWGVPLVKSLYSDRSQPVAESAPSPPPANPAAAQAVVRPPQAKTPVVAVVSTSPPVATPAALSEQDVAAADRAKQEESATAAAAKERAKLDEQKRLEAQRLQAQEEQRIKERNQVIEQIKTTLDNELAQVATFKSNCLTKLNDNTNKIAKLSYSYRKSTGEINEEMRATLADMTTKEDDFLKKTANVVQGYVTNLQSDPQPLIGQLAVQLTRIENDRQSFMDNFNLLATNIANAPKRGGISLFK